MIGSSEHVEISSFRGQLLLIMQKTQPPSLIPDLPISGIKLVVHGPELIDTGRVALVVEALGAIGPLRVLAGGTMARVAALDKHLTFIDTSQNLHTSDALNDVSDNEVPVLANCGKTPSTGCVFGQIVSSRVRRSIVHVEGPGSVRGKVIVWRGVDGGLWRCVQYIAEQLSHRLSLELVEQNKKALPVEQTSEVITRRIHGAKPGELLLIEGMVVGTAVDSDVVISAQNGSIVDITGVNTKAHGLERIGELDGGQKGLGRKIQAVVDVGEVHDAEAVEFAAEAGDGHAEFADLDAASFAAAGGGGAAGSEVQAQAVEAALVEAVQPAVQGPFARFQENGREGEAACGRCGAIRHE